MNNKSFIALLVIAAIMVFGALAENTRSILNSKKPEIKVGSMDTLKVEEIKNKIHHAGIIPRDAMHWKEL